MRYAHEVVGRVLDGAVLCEDCAEGQGDPIFLGDELADNDRCEDCNDVLSGDSETRTEREAREALEAALEVAAEKERVACIERSLRELDEDVAATENDVEALKRELERKVAEARIKRESLLRRLDEKD